jgi:prepilin-type N-terminal cleavage/methylation domain-containing protein
MRRPRHGFTLIELLVAMVVSALVLTIAFRSISIAADATARLREEQRVAMKGSVARAQLEAWLRNASVFDGAEAFVGTHASQRDGPPRDELTFAVTDGGVLWPGPRRVRLWIGLDATATQGIGVAVTLPPTALLAELVALDGQATVHAETLTVAPGAVGMRLRYRGRFGRREGWAGEWASTRQLPRAVELRLVSASGTAEALAPILAVPFLVPLGWDDARGEP